MMASGITPLSCSLGGQPCRALSVRPSRCRTRPETSSRPSSAPAPHRKRWSSAVASPCGPPQTIARPTRRSPPDWAAIATPWASGANASSRRASTACTTCPAPADPGAFPPSAQIAVVAIATSKTADHDRPVNGWTLDQIAATILKEAHAETISRSTVGRILAQADLKPHKSVYWLNSHDPDFEAIAKEVCGLYVQAPTFSQQGRLLLCCDEKTGMQILGRPFPTQPPAPGKPEEREFEYIRPGTRTLITSFVVATGEVLWDLGPTRTNRDFRAHVQHVAKHFPEVKRFDWVVDNLNTHMSLELCEAVAALCGLPLRPKELKTQRQRRVWLSDPEHKHVFHYLPRHGSWLNQVELWFSVLTRQFLRRGDFVSVPEFEERLVRYLEAYNLEQAHPYRWTYTGQPLVRRTPFRRTRRQRQQGRAWFGTRPQLYERVLHPPRPYRRTKLLAANL
jgi:DDE superfamily endonuclease